MARVTVEDCVLRVPNRFELVVLAGQRSREISAGAELTVDRDRDKNPVVALREIADETIELEELREEVVSSHQRHVEIGLDEGDIDAGGAALQAALRAGAEADDEAPVDVDLDLASLAKELAAQAGDFKSRDD